MDILKPDEKSKKEIKRLWGAAFKEGEPFLSWYFDKFWKSENSLAAYADGELAGALTAEPHTLVLRGKNIRVSYIGGVSVWERLRGRGIATELMRAMLREEARRGDMLSILIPVSSGFYLRMGYEVCSGSTERTAAFDNDNPCGYELRELSLSDAHELNRLYEQYCVGKNMFVVRNEACWRFVLDRAFFPGSRTLGAFMGGALLAYAVTFEKTVYEAVGEESAVAALLGSVSGGAHITLTLPGDDKPVVMARAVDVSGIFNAMPELGINIEIIDSFIPENSGLYKKGGSKTGTDLVMDISFFTQCCTGYRSASELWKEGKISGEKFAAELLTEYFTKENNYINLIMSEDF